MLKLLLGDPNARKLKRYQPIVSDVNLLEEEIAPLSDQQLRDKTAGFQECLANTGSLANQRRSLTRSCQGSSLSFVKPESGCLACVISMSSLLAAWSHGQIAKDENWRRKTLVATLPSYLNALTGRGVHVVTVNDYLARRDAEWMGQVHRFLGLSVGLIQQDMRPEGRRRNYNCDITYATNSELGFDYLRDNMAADISEMVQRNSSIALLTRLIRSLLTKPELH